MSLSSFQRILAALTIMLGASIASAQVSVGGIGVGGAPSAGAGVGGGAIGSGVVNQGVQGAANAAGNAAGNATTQPGNAAANAAGAASGQVRQGANAAGNAAGQAGANIRQGAGAAANAAGGVAGQAGRDGVNAAGNAAGNLSTQAGQNAANIGATVGANVDASANRPTLGINVREIANGLQITNLNQGGVAQLGGVRSGDVIQSLNGTRIISHQQLVQAIQSAAQTGRPLTLQVQRNGQLQNLQLNMPANTARQMTSGFRGANVGNLSANFDRFEQDFRSISTPSIPVNLRNDFNRLNQQVAQIRNSIRDNGQNPTNGTLQSQLQTLRGDFDRLAGQVQDQDLRSKFEGLRDQLNNLNVDEATSGIRSGSVVPNAQGTVNSATGGNVEATRNSPSGAVNNATKGSGAAAGSVSPKQ